MQVYVLPNFSVAGSLQNGSDMGKVKYKNIVKHLWTWRKQNINRNNQLSTRKIPPKLKQILFKPTEVSSSFTKWTFVEILCFRITHGAKKPDRPGIQPTKELWMNSSIPQRNSCFSLQNTRAEFRGLTWFWLLSFPYPDVGMCFQLLLNFCCIFCCSLRRFGALPCKGLSHWMMFSGRAALLWPQEGPNPSTGFSWSWFFPARTRIALEMKTFYIKDYLKYLSAADNQRCSWFIDIFQVKRR